MSSNTTTATTTTIKILTGRPSTRSAKTLEHMIPIVTPHYGLLSAMLPATLEGFERATNGPALMDALMAVSDSLSPTLRNGWVQSTRSIDVLAHKIVGNGTPINHVVPVNVEVWTFNAELINAPTSDDNGVDVKQLLAKMQNAMLGIASQKQYADVADGITEAIGNMVQRQYDLLTGNVGNGEIIPQIVIAHKPTSDAQTDIQFVTKGMVTLKHGDKYATTFTMLLRSIDDIADQLSVAHSATFGSGETKVKTPTLESFIKAVKSNQNSENNPADTVDEAVAALA